MSKYKQNTILEIYLQVISQKNIFFFRESRFYGKQAIKIVNNIKICFTESGSRLSNLR